MIFNKSAEADEPPAETTQPRLADQPQTGRECEGTRLHKTFRRMLDDPKTTPEQKDEARRNIKKIDSLVNAKRRKAKPKQ